MKPYSLCTALLGGALLVGLSSLAQADPEWPPLNGNETRKEIPVNVDGVLFFSGRYVYDVPRYSLRDFQKTDSYERYNWHWWAEVPVGDPNGINTRITRQPPVAVGTLPALPALPPVKRLGASSAPAPSASVTPLQRLPAVSPQNNNLPKLPALPPQNNSLPTLPSIPPLR